MSNERAERLAQSLRTLPFVEPINWEGSDETGMLKVLCRVRKDKATAWARVVEAILLRAEEVKGTPQYWDSHICRLYMLKNKKLVYGWLVAITPHSPENVDRVLDSVISCVRKEAGPQNHPAPLQGQAPVPVGRAQAPEADARGNPIVPDSHRVEFVPMAGLPANADRNSPGDGGRGAYGMFKSRRLGDTFKPPGARGR